MAITQLKIKHVRNLNNVALRPDPAINLFVGENASGKTSLLEAIHLLALSRSFRTQHIKHVIQHEKEQLTVFGQISHSAGVEIPVGVARQKDKLIVQIGGKRIQGLNQLAEMIPIQVINNDSHKILESGPQYRRRLLDWGVFHVEHHYFGVWQRYIQGVRQRNSALKSRKGIKELKIWDRSLSDLGEQIDQLRTNYLSGLRPLFTEKLEKLAGINVDIRYRRGWDKDQSLGEVLERTFLRDSEKGFTQFGPHRADLQFYCGSVPALEKLSRGQQKMLVSALRLAQVEYQQLNSPRRCVILVDDLPAELDHYHRQAFLKLLSKDMGQIFITATEANLIQFEGLPDYKMFHVEHGEVRPAVVEH